MDIVRDTENNEMQMVIATIDANGEIARVAGEVTPLDDDINGVEGEVKPLDDDINAKAVRFWAGATFENRETAPFRVTQDGSVVMSKATVEGVIKAISGTIGGFEIANGRIGAIPDDPNVDYGGMGFTNHMMKYSDFEDLNNSHIISAIGDNVNPGNDVPMLARFEYTDNQNVEILSNNGISLKAKYRPAYQHPWYIQRAIDYDGNVYGIGQRAVFDDGYIGKPFIDIIEAHIGVAHAYFFDTIESSLSNIRLPNKAMIDKVTGKRDITFLLYLQVGWLGNNNKIRILGVDNGCIFDNNCNRPNGGYGWYEMAQGDSMILRYYNGYYYTVQYRT